MVYSTGSHNVYYHRYHVVWSTKYRYDVLRGELRLRIREIIRQVCRELNVEIIKGVLSTDHVHMFIAVPPKIRDQPGHSADEGAFVLSCPAGVSGNPKTLLGTPFLGQGLLLNHQRQHYRRRDTSVSREPCRRSYRRQSVVIQCSLMSTMGFSSHFSKCSTEGSKGFPCVHAPARSPSAVVGRLWGTRR